MDPFNYTEEFLFEEWDRRIPSRFHFRYRRIERPTVLRVSFRLAARYSFPGGMIYLTGDASHYHSPAGCQIINTILQSAANLS